MRILVTGSSGTLGAEIVRRLRTRHEVLGVDLVPGPETDLCGSVTDRSAVSEWTSGVDAVIHTASLHAPQVASRTKQEFIDTNVSGVLNLLEAAAQSDVKRFVYTSTTSIYGHALLPTDRAVWVTEELVPRPRDLYDITKLAAEELCRHFAETTPMGILALRTGRFFTEPPEVMAVHRLNRGLDVRDAAEAHLLALQSKLKGFEVFNISARSPFDSDDLPELLRNAPAVIQSYFPDAPDQFRRQGWQLPQSLDRVYVSAKAERLLGFRPRYNFGEYMRAVL